jgi:putative oxidoreductase
LSLFAGPSIPPAEYQEIMMNTAATLRSPAKTMTTTLLLVSWICRLAAAVILLQTLFFKFSAAPESVYIFTKVGMEPWGRIGSGVVELIAAILLLTPRFGWAGAALALGVMAGAILSHLTVLGIEVQGDGGLLFGLAITVFVASAVILFIHRAQIPVIGSRL